MTDKLFRISKFGSLSALSDVCDDEGKMLNSEVLDKLNEQQATIEKLEWVVDVKQRYIEKLEKRLEDE